MRNPISGPMESRPTVDIDLDSLCANYRMLAKAAEGAETAAVVKCDAYGLGAAVVARELAKREGCRTFFVAYASDGAELREALEYAAPSATIYVLNGPDADTLNIFTEHVLTPVLNTLEQARLCAERCARAPAALHIDTGMNRLGAPLTELSAISALGLKLDLVMSHLACSSEPAHPMNERQRRAFEEAAARFPGVRRSLSASAGALLGAQYRYDMIRPGAALYGVSPFDRPDPRIVPVATLTAPVVQLRDAKAGECVGYGATWSAKRPCRLATVALGYGDGFPRSADGSAFVGGAPCPIAGRVSMDLVVLDVTDAPQPVAIGERAEFFGPHIAIEDTAAACGTIGYELLTRLGRRLKRRYLRDGRIAAEG